MPKQFPDPILPTCEAVTDGLPPVTGRFAPKPANPQTAKISNKEVAQLC